MPGDPIISSADLLESMNTPYCLVGGYAVSAYGVPRETGDKAAGPLDLSDAEYILQSSPAKIDLELLVNKARQLSIACSTFLFPHTLLASSGLPAASASRQRQVPTPEAEVRN